MSGLRAKRWHMIKAGVSIIDITPPPGLKMAGFGARIAPATGAHDPLTVRALSVGDTALVTVDVIGLDHKICRRIRRRCCLPNENIIIHATHTHGGPASMPGRLGLPSDSDFLEFLEAACVKAIDESVERQQCSVLSFAEGDDPDIARNRRHPDGPVDRSLPIFKVRGDDGQMLAVLVNYACHPVVLGADNNLWTSDYPHFVRDELSKTYPGASILFLTGCVGDLNTGHSAQASLSLQARDERTFKAAHAIGRRIADNVRNASERPLGIWAESLEGHVSLSFERREKQDPTDLIQIWEGELESAGPVRSTLLKIWINWAKEVAPLQLTALKERVSVLDWGGMQIVGMPGEIFAETALYIRAHSATDCLMLAGFCEDNPGYIPPISEYESGGYEVDEAHRYYGQPASFVCGSAELIMHKMISISAKLEKSVRSVKRLDD